jgi:photosystem II stability/assembly factor-like uncharacterized protein
MAANGNHVFVLSGGYYVTSSDGGKTVTNNFSSIDLSKVKGAQALMDLQLLAKDSLLLATSQGLYLSGDTGKTWTEKLYPTGEIFAKLIWKNRSEVLALGQNVGLGAKVFYSSDGGANWTPKPNLTLAASMFYSGDLLIAWPQATSADNGATWKPLFPAAYELRGVHFAAASKGSLVVIGSLKGQLNYSFDKGRSFTAQDTIPGSEDVMALKFLSNGALYAGDRNSNIFYSPDTGKTWTKKYSNAISYNAVKFSVSADEKTIVLTRGGQPVVSLPGHDFDYVTLGGGSLAETVKPNGDLIGARGLISGVEIVKFFWSTSPTPLDTVVISGDGAVDMVAYDNNVGYLVTANSTTKETHIFKTTNGFASVAQTATIKDIVYSPGVLQLLGPDTLMLSGDGKAFWHYSYDGGKTWTKVDAPFHPQYLTVHPSIKKALFFDSKEYLLTLNDAGLYLNITSTTAASAIRPFVAGRASHRLLAGFDPLTGRLTLSNLDATSVDIGIFDQLGRSVFALLRYDGSRPIDASALARGRYFLRVKNAQGTALAAPLLKN